MSAGRRLFDVEERIATIEGRHAHLSSLPRIMLNDRSNPLEVLDELQFRRRYHMKKDTAVFVMGLIKTDLDYTRKRAFHIPPLLQFLSALRFFTTGSFQIVVGDLYLTSQSTVSKVVKRVAVALAKRSKDFIKYPTFGEAAEQARKFARIGKFPGVVGCIDGTHIQIRSPGGNNAELFRDRKGDFSINVQAIGNADMEFTDVVARWYGSAHDSRIFDNSVIKDKLENGLVPGLILGDSGYACTPYLMTPLRNPVSRKEKAYNKAQIKTRNLIERLFGAWKRRYPCLNLLRTKLSTSLVIIVALAMLFNICRRHRDELEEDDPGPVTDDDEGVEVVEEDNSGPHLSTLSGRAARAQLIARKF